ncbi:Integrator complex subunit 8, partial [Orchesella cincta]
MFKITEQVSLRVYKKEDAMDDMVSNANSLFMWVEFLLDKKRLKQHLSEQFPDPSATTLLTQFIINADRAIHLTNGTNANGNNGGNSGSNQGTKNEDDSPQPMTAEQLASTCRARKTRSLILMAMQVTSFLGWDLDALTKIPIALQHSLMKHMLNLINAENDKGNKPSERSKEFLRVLYHRWVLRSLNNHNSVNRSTRAYNVVVPGAEHFNTPLNIESVIKQLNEEESAQYLKNFFSQS